MTPRRAYIGLGANQGDPRASLDAAIEALRSMEHCRFVAASPYYTTEPIDVDGPDFLNGVAALDTTLDPYALLLHLLDIELLLGRERKGLRRAAPRTADLDLLLVGNLTMASAPLTLPHPRMHQRAFVLKPLLDLDPQIVLPGLGPARDLLPAVAARRAERADG
ncbi:MAG: 2-amino-4-hydroxy-6-hydroxymethyldihydropteridine diphosphokinase [Betaproteobacteria bacterium]